MKGCLEVTASAMSEYGDEIWNRYFTDFAHKKLHLQPEMAPLTNDILKAYIGPVTGSNALARLVSLHVRLHVYQMDLTKVATNLKPISKMQQSLYPAATGSLADLSFASTLHDPQSIVRIPQTFVNLIVEMLYTFVLHMSTTENKSESLTSWYQRYSDIVSASSNEIFTKHSVHYVYCIINYLIRIDVNANNGREYHSWLNLSADPKSATHSACYLPGHAMLS